MSSDSTFKTRTRGDHTNPFKNSQGHWRTMSLFHEEYRPEFREGDPMFTLKDYDLPNGCPSLKKLYLELEDLTEFEFADKYLGGWPHWEKLNGNKQLQGIFAQWRKELQLKLKSRALATLIKTAGDPNNRNTYEANKFLITGGWLPKEDKEAGKRGRPSKEEVKDEMAKQMELEKQLNEDLKRLELN